MKPKVFVLPAIALLAAGIFLGSQHRAISSIEEKTRLLLQPGTAMPGDAISSGRPPRPRGEAPGKSSVNWRRIAEIGHERYPGIFEKQELLLLDNRIRDMTPEELLAALAEIRALHLDIRSRGELEGKLLQSLAEKDPGAALDYLTDGDNDHLGLAIGPGDILASWAARDGGGAIAWLDGKIASGTFASKSLEGKNSRYLWLEAALVAHLIGSDPGAASLRLSAIPEAHRGYLLSHLFYVRNRIDRPLSDGELSAYASLVRSGLIAGEQEEAIIYPVATILRQAGYNRVDEYFEQAGVTPAERGSAVRQVAWDKFRWLMGENKLTTDEIDSFRQWAGSHVPEGVDRITASALASTLYGGDTAFQRAADLVLHYREETGSDDILVHFLQSSHRNREQARALAEKISDPAQRAQVLEGLK